MVRVLVGRGEGSGCIRDIVASWLRLRGHYAAKLVRFIDGLF